MALALLAGSLTAGAQTMVVLGDSYVANHRRPKSETWHYQAACNLGLEYRNYGRNGSSVAWDRQRFGPRMVQRCLEMTDTANVVLVIAGHNDATLLGNNRDSLHQFADSLSLSALPSAAGEISPCSHRLRDALARGEAWFRARHQDHSSCV